LKYLKNVNEFKLIYFKTDPLPCSAVGDKVPGLLYPVWSGDAKSLTGLTSRTSLKASSLDATVKLPGLSFPVFNGGGDKSSP
jgi:hypothetical protein